jgi:hypothetical protein
LRSALASEMRRRRVRASPFAAEPDPARRTETARRQIALADSAGQVRAFWLAPYRTLARRAQDAWCTRERMAAPARPATPGGTLMQTGNATDPASPTAPRRRRLIVLVDGPFPGPRRLSGKLDRRAPRARRYSSSLRRCRPPGERWIIDWTLVRRRHARMCSPRAGGRPARPLARPARHSQAPPRSLHARDARPHRRSFGRATRRQLPAPRNRVRTSRRLLSAGSSAAAGLLRMRRGPQPA